jgi:hypothetical protein
LVSNSENKKTKYFYRVLRLMTIIAKNQFEAKKIRLSPAVENKDKSRMKLRIKELTRAPSFSGQLDVLDMYSEF